MVAGCEIPYQAWKKSGDKTSLQAGYGECRALVEFMTRHIDPSHGLPIFGYYGDWVAPKPTPKPATSSFSFILAVSRLTSMAHGLGNMADAQHYNASLQTYKSAWHKEFYSTSCSTSKPQTPSTGCVLQGKELASCSCPGKLAAVAMECEPSGHGVPPPTCGKQNNTKLTLMCKPGTGTIKKITFAAYGDISGSCASGFVATGCHSSATKAVVEAACLGKTSCAIDASVVSVAKGMDPCPGKAKVLAVEASGCEPTFQPPTPPPPPPITHATSCYATDTQTGNAMALYLNIPPTPEIKQGTMNALLADYADANNHPTFGTVGARIFLPVLATGGEMGVALDFATLTTQPSYGYMVSTPEMPGERQTVLSLLPLGCHSV